MRRWSPAWGLVVVLALVAPRAASAQAPDPLRGVTGDLRLLTTTLPSSAGWTPTLPTDAIVPGRGFGAEAGAHLLIGPGRYRRLGLGASGLLAQGRATGENDAPTVTTRFMAAAPHLSMNFGHGQGWSTLSLGAGVAKVTSTLAGGAADPAGWGTVIHYGFGARWFISQHVAASLDLRFWALTPRAATLTRPSSPATTRVVLGGGVAFH